MPYPTIVNREGYLKRIRFEGKAEPNLANLSAMQRAHLTAVPFENLEIIHRKPLRFDVDSLFEKIVTRRRGGYCYELNTLFGALLADVGFTVSIISARVAVEDGGFGPPFDHMALLVHLGGTWLVDVGFGSSAITPLQLVINEPQARDGQLYRIVERDAEYAMQCHRDGEWKDEYLFDLAPRTIGDFQTMMKHHQTSPASHFTKNTIVTIPTPGGRLTISGRRLITTRGDARIEEELDEKRYRNVLATYFGIVD